MLSYPAEVSVVDSEIGLKLNAPAGVDRWQIAPATVVWDLAAGTAGGVLALAVAIEVVIPLVLAALGVDSPTVGVPETLLYVFNFLRTPDGGVEFSMGSGVFLVGTVAGRLCVYLRARRRTG